MEDGTGEAQMYVYDDMVPTVLKLSTQQWHHLQDLAMRTGELLYQRQWRGRNNPPEVQKHMHFEAKKLCFPLQLICFCNILKPHKKKFKIFSSTFPFLRQLALVYICRTTGQETSYSTLNWYGLDS